MKDEQDEKERKEREEEEKKAKEEEDKKKAEEEDEEEEEEEVGANLITCANHSKIRFGECFDESTSLCRFFRL